MSQRSCVRVRRSTVFAMARMAHRVPWRVVAGGTVVAAVGVVVPGDPGVWLSGSGVAVSGGGAVWWWFRDVAGAWSTKRGVQRRAYLDQRAGGTATCWDIAEVAGVGALRSRARVLRPSLASWTSREVRRLPVEQYAVEIVRVGHGWPGQRVFCSCEDATLRIGGPRTGKTLSLARHGLDAPGALITTSTRLDLAELVHGVRRSRGAVYVFNPAGLGGVPSSMVWRVLGGCEDWATAQRRAADLMPRQEGETERWDAKGRVLLALLLQAAAVAGTDLRTVSRWIAAEDDPQTQAEIMRAVLAGGEGAADRVLLLRRHWATNDRTRTSVTQTLTEPLAWVADPRARECGDAPAHAEGLVDVADLLARGQTLHLVGGDVPGLGPLIGALVAEIAHQARLLAGHRPAGRLDPPVTMLLDEAALCPVPLDRWTADMGGRGITLHISVQSLAQLRAGWAEAGAGTILANVAALIVFGGGVSSGDLRDLSALTGEHRVRVVGGQDTGPDGSAEHRWAPVCSPAQIRALPAGTVLVLRRALPVTIGHAPSVLEHPAWQPATLTQTTTTQTITRTGLARALDRATHTLRTLHDPAPAPGPGPEVRDTDDAPARGEGA